MFTFATMSTADIRTRVRELSNVLNGCVGETWDAVYEEYCTLSAVLNERYREENQPAFDAFYAKHIKDKTWEEIHPADWDFYSDWHKDMFGFRPKHI